MSATEERREERGAAEVFDLAGALAEAEEQVRRGMVEDGLLQAVRRLRDPGDALQFLDELERRLADGWSRLGKDSLEALGRLEGAALPRVAEYARRRLGVEVPIEAERGWTDKVLEALRDIKVDDDDEVWKRGMDEYLYPAELGIEGVVGLPRLEEAMKYVPARELLRRVGGSPRFIDFAEAASRVPGSYLRVRVAAEEGGGEGIAVYGIDLPLREGVDEVVEWLLGRALRPPGSFRFHRVNGRYYLYISWG